MVLYCTAWFRRFTYFFIGTLESSGTSRFLKYATVSFTPSISITFIHPHISRLSSGYSPKLNIIKLTSNTKSPYPARSFFRKNYIYIPKKQTSPVNVSPSAIIFQQQKRPRTLPSLRTRRPSRRPTTTWWRPWRAPLLRRLRQATTPKHSSLRGEPPKKAQSLVVRPVNGLIRVPDIQDMFSNRSNVLKHCRVSPTKSSNNRVAWFFRPDSRKTTASPNHMVIMRHANITPRTFFLSTITLTGTDRLRLAAILFRGIGAAQVAAPWTVPGTVKKAVLWAARCPNKAYSYGPIRYQLCISTELTPSKYQNGMYNFTEITSFNQL